MANATLRAVSPKRQGKIAERSRLIAQYRREGRNYCEIHAWIALATYSWAHTTALRPLVMGLRGCTYGMDGLHERRKRSSSGSLVNRQNLIPACNPCNHWVEDYPELAQRIGLVVRPGDPEWEELAA